MRVGSRGATWETEKVLIETKKEYCESRRLGVQIPGGATFYQKVDFVYFNQLSFYKINLEYFFLHLKLLHFWKHINENIKIHWTSNSRNIKEFFFLCLFLDLKLCPLNDSLLTSFSVIYYLLLSLFLLKIDLNYEIWMFKVLEILNVVNIFLFTDIIVF